MAKAPQPKVSIDGMTHSATREKELNALAAATFGTPSGQAFLAYLKTITVHRVNGPNISDAELRHLEGQRYLVGLIETRMLSHKKEDAK